MMVLQGHNRRVKPNLNIGQSGRTVVSRDAPVVAGMRNPKLWPEAVQAQMRSASHKPEEPAITAAFRTKVNAPEPKDARHAHLLGIKPLLAQAGARPPLAQKSPVGQGENFCG